MMSQPKEKILLTEAQETLLITLYAKGRACPQTILVDEKSRQIMERVAYDFSKLKVPIGTSLTVCVRARKLDDYVRQFLERHPDAIILHLGCGLDSRCERVDYGEALWYDLDVPDVIDLRKNFFSETENYHMIPAWVNDLDWMQAITYQGQPVFAVAEGLMMYLPEQQVKELILALKDKFPGCELAFDAYSEFTVRRVGAHPSLRKTGAVIQWGVDDPNIIERWGDGIRLEEEWFFIKYETIQNLALIYQLIFKVTGLFSVVRKAHRILYYSLG
jgi:O-methyltransferase involved in polyketide biosynthesis